MVQLRYLKEEVNGGDGIDYEPKIITKLQFRCEKKPNSPYWTDWTDVPTEWAHKIKKEKS